MPLIDQTATIARLNDRARHGLDRTARITMTRTLLAKLTGESEISPVLAQPATLAAMRRCTFSEDSPERDFASFEVNGERAFMKIDYYAEDLEHGSEDPADASATIRVITIMAPEDY
jgi:hypothetical protein